MWVTHYFLLGFFDGQGEPPVVPPGAEQSGGVGPFSRIQTAELTARVAAAQRRQEAESLARQKIQQAAQPQVETQPETQPQAQPLQAAPTDPVRIDLPTLLDVRQIAANAIAAAQRVPDLATVAGRELIAAADAQAALVLRQRQVRDNRNRAQMLLALLDGWR